MNNAPGREALAAVLSRVAILTNDTAKMVGLSVGGGSLTVSTANPSMGEASEEIAVEHAGDDVKIGLNHEYVQQFLQVLGTEKVEIRLKDSSTQALLVPVDDAELEHQYVIMPMRLS